MIPKKYEHVAFAFVMALLMVTVLSFSAISINYGWRAGFFGVWLRTLALLYPIAVTSILVLRPLAMRIVRWLVAK
jgi:hypothetical protein